MTNQNPAVPQPPQGGNSSKQNRDILAKVNAHADRSMDRLFADIDELLGDDLTHDTNSAPQHNSYATEQYPQLQQPIYPPQRSLSAGADTPIEQPAKTAKPKRTMPLWLKALLGIGVTSLAAGSLLTWLVNERKISLPQHIDTSWLPFQSQRVSPQDAKFADYMRKSIAKIDATTQTTLATNNTPTPATTIVDPSPATTPADPVATTPTIVTATAPVAPAALKPKIALVKTLPKGNRPGAIFEIDRQSKTVNVGQTIGKSNWSLVSVNKSEITIKRKGGEIRSVDVGQKF